jgi:glucose/arabinose dehydrogenase/mono/diheme cytochrome c family protein
MISRAGGRAVLTAALGLGAVALLAAAAAPKSAPKSAATPAACAGDNGGITLPPGFCATVFADELGHIRQLSVGPDGVLYANSEKGRPVAGQPTVESFLVALKDTDADGKADQVARFGQTSAEGSDGGTGVVAYKNFVYAEVNDLIVRYALTPGSIAPKGKAEVVIKGLPTNGNHGMHPFIIDAKGMLFVDLGSATNSCQTKDRMTGVAGADPCVELETRAGTWRYDANKLGQVFSAKERYATGIRNGEGFGIDAAGRMYVTQHGRDQLLQNWPALYPDAAKATELPAEEMVLLKQGGDYGWPYCYFDGAQGKLVLAPEYGGDGGKTVGRCAGKSPPIAHFPAHWAPNDLKIYVGGGFPAAYRGGALIAFHGSWNRAPAPQAGYNVVFQPLRDGKASGPWVLFADGFAGPAKALGKATYRPTGLAVAPDGAVFISDDVRGRIWRVTYRGSASAAIAAAPAPTYAQAAAPVTPAGLPVPPGATAAQVELGGRIFRGAAAGGTCAGCHGPDGKGSTLGPDLTTGTWLWGDGSLTSISDTIAKGVATPKKYQQSMPAMGGAQLSPADLAAVSAYVWAVGHKPK